MGWMDCQRIQEKLQNIRSKLIKFSARRDGYGVWRYNAARQEYHELLKRYEDYSNERVKQSEYTNR